MQISQTARELDYRADDGIEVTLFWDEPANRLTVAVADSRTGEAFELAAHPENALDVFHHPFAYAAFGGVDYAVADGVAAETLAAWESIPSV